MSQIPTPKELQVIATNLSNFLDAYHDASPFLEGPLCTETLIVSRALVDELATLGQSVRLVWKEGSEYPGGVGTALISVTRIGQSLVDQWVTGRTIRLDQADEERLGKALEWLRADPPKRAGDANVTKKKGEPDEGKAARCVGIYMDAIVNKLTLPSGAEVARKVKCSRSTASRAISKFADMYRQINHQTREDNED